MGIDDPLDSSAVHLVNGVLGMLLVAFVSRPSHVDLLTGSPCGGIFYTSMGWLQLGMQVLGKFPRSCSLAAVGWACLVFVFKGALYHTTARQ